MAKTSKSESNAKNALKSSGPKSALGKAASAQNARRHGVLSAQLILPSENHDEFDELVDQLQQEFKPEGLLENTLVERIAIALWRQMRLVNAESAEILLRQQTSLVSATYPICTTLNLHGHDVDVQNEWNGFSNFNDPRTSAELFELVIRCVGARLKLPRCARCRITQSEGRLKMTSLLISVSHLC